MSKLWSDKSKLHPKIEKFTIGNDAVLDLKLAKWDVIGSLAHSRMLAYVHIISNEEFELLFTELHTILELIKAGEFSIEEGVEDVHSQIELMLTKRIGDVGKKIHTARSRNDQVLLDLRLFMRDEIRGITYLIKELFDSFLLLSQKNKEHLMPGYTHLQIAMPSSFGMWFASFAESLADDLIMLESAYQLVNKNPLGSAAGYGSSFPIKRDITTKLLGFETLNYNSIYAQASRVKVEMAVANAFSSLATTLSRFASDACLFMSQNFGFINLPKEFTTGSSIMPHKKNPDVFELLRAKCNEIKVHSLQLLSFPNNLTTGYFRDYQLLKEPLFKAFDDMKQLLEISILVIPQIIIKENIMESPLYQVSYSVEEVEQRVKAGESFRSAYMDVSEQINKNEFKRQYEVDYSHEGSLGNLCNKEISGLFETIFYKFKFSKVDKTIDHLIQIGF